MKGHTLQRCFLLALMALAALVFVLGVIYLDPGKGKTQTAEPVEIFPHVLRIDDEFVDEPGQPRERKIERDSCVRRHHPFGG